MILDVEKLKATLQELADIQFQNRTWLSANGKEISSFSELISQIFDDTGLAHLLQSGLPEQTLDSEAIKALRELDASISNVDQSLPPFTLIHTPEMRSVRRCAADALRALSKNEGKH